MLLFDTCVADAPAGDSDIDAGGDEERILGVAVGQVASVTISGTAYASSSKLEVTFTKDSAIASYKVT